MKDRIPKEFVISTPEYLKLQTKVNMYCAKFGCKAVSRFLEGLEVIHYKRDHKNIGQYLISKVCEEFQITRYELFESNSRTEALQARKIYCFIADELFEVSQAQIASAFGRSRHVVKRYKAEMIEALEEPNKSPYQKLLSDAHNRVSMRMKAYCAFQVKKQNKDGDSETPAA